MLFSKVILSLIFCASVSAQAVRIEDFPQPQNKAKFISEKDFNADREDAPFWLGIMDEGNKNNPVLTKLGTFDCDELTLPQQPQEFMGVYGPYVGIRPGLYLAQMTFIVDSNVQGEIGTIDLVQRGLAERTGKAFKIITSTPITINSSLQTFRFRFTVPSLRIPSFDERFEFRFKSNGKHKVSIQSMAVYPAKQVRRPAASTLKDLDQQREDYELAVAIAMSLNEDAQATSSSQSSSSQGSSSSSSSASTSVVQSSQGCDPQTIFNQLMVLRRMMELQQQMNLSNSKK